MKRDMDLIRRILLEVEAHPQSSGPVRLQIEGYTREEISYHVGLLAQAEYIEALSTEALTGTRWAPMRLTWDGHEFLDAARNETVWEATKDRVAEKFGTVSLAVFQALLIEEAKRWFGLP